MRLKGLVVLVCVGLVGCSNQDPVAHESPASVTSRIDANATVVIRQVFGNDSQSPGFDFVELFNRGSAPQSLNGWSVQYADAQWAGYFQASGLFNTLPNVVLPPGGSFMIREGGTGGYPVPFPVDLVASPSFNFSPASGKIALVRSTFELDCPQNSCSPAALASIVDLVAYGPNANFFEGSGPAPHSGNTGIVRRRAGGFQDTNDNAQDFVDVLPCSATGSDPRAQATVDPNIVTSFAAAAAPLYQGPNASQLGVANNALDAAKLAVVQGRVLNSAGQPVPCAIVTVPGAPQYGSANTWADGRFAIAVNGGGDVTIEASAQGVFSSQRTTATAWNRFADVGDIRMIPYSASAQAVSSSSTTVTVVAGTSEQDEDGTRQAVLFVPRQTTATVAGQALQNYNVSITEVTNRTKYGRDAMPASLPPQSGFTYAVHLAVQGAENKDVTFTKPIPFYVDNFLAFPVGEPVPVGRYDRAAKRWITETSGLVIKILSVDANGRAELDINSTPLSALGSGQDLLDELSAIAARYCPQTVPPSAPRTCTGTPTFWRFKTDHFSAWDVNWGWGPPPNASTPSPQPPHTGTGRCEQAGSIIECQTQVLREEVPITATPFKLVYSSGRQSGSARHLAIPVTGNVIPPLVKRVELTIQAGGRTWKPAIPLQSNYVYQFYWDGIDVAGRLLYGKQPINVSVGYTYDGVYVTTPRFGYSGNGTAISGSRARIEVTLSQPPWRGLIGSNDARYAALGGWTIDVHHQLDPSSGLVYLGDGTTTEEPPSELNTIAGGGITSPPVYPSTPADATTRQIAAIDTAVTAPDGTTYIAAGSLVHRVSAGKIDTIAVFSNATPVGLALGPDGDLYIALGGKHCIKKVQLQNNMVVSDTLGLCGDTGGFTDNVVGAQARFNRPEGLAFGSDGAMYIADLFNNRIRVVRDGWVSSMPGGPVGSGPWKVAVARNGNVFYTAQDTVQRYAVDGTRTTFASYSLIGPNGSVGVGPDDSVYLAAGNRIARVAADGSLVPVVGNGKLTPTSDHLLPMQAALPMARSVGFGADGAIYATTGSSPNILRKVVPRIATLAGNVRTVPSKDAQQLYVFDAAGKHLKTLDAHTGSVLYAFGYSAAGVLASITDLSGRQTVITREVATGKATAIVAPDQQQTTLQIDATGDKALRAVTRPDSTGYAFDYGAGTMLTVMKDPVAVAGGAGVYSFHYTNGLLDQDTDPRVGSTPQQLSLSDSPTATTVTHTSPGGKTTSYKTEWAGTLQTTTVTRPDALPVVEQKQIDGTPSFTASDSRLYDTVLTRPDGVKVYANHALDSAYGTKYVSEELVELPSQTRRLDQTVVSTVLDPNTGAISSQSTTTTRNGDGAHPESVTYSADTRIVTITSRAGRKRYITLDSIGRTSHVQVAGIPNALDVEYEAATGRLQRIRRGLTDGSAARQKEYGYFSAGPRAGYLSSVTEGSIGASIFPLPKVTTFARDLLGQPLTETVWNNTTTWGWDANGNLNAVTPAGKPKHDLLYTRINELDTYTPPPLAGMATPTAYSYNSDRQIRTETRPGGTVITWNYDNAGRRDTLTAASGTLLDYDYYTGSPPAGGAAGRIKTIKSGTGTTAVTLDYKYDGRLITQVDWTGAVTGTVAWTYDSDFFPATETAKGSPIKFGYDLDKLLTCASATACGATPAADALVVTRGTSGLVTKIVLGNVTETLTYNNFGELASQTASFGTGPSPTPLMTLSYDDGGAFARDAIGRVARRYESFAGAVANFFDYSYEQGGLTAVWRNNVRKERYTYDGNGNRIADYAINGVWSDLTPRVFTDDQDRLINYGGTAANTTSGGWVYNYTPNGEVSTKTKAGVTHSFTYDLRGNLVLTQVTGGASVSYLVDGKNRRVGKKSNNVLTRQWLYRDDLSPVAELDGSGNLVSRFVYGTRSNIPDYVIRGGNTYRVLSDELGSPRMAVDVASGAVVYRADYDAFGAQTMVTGSADWIPFGFAGGLYDPEPGTGLVRFGARDYETTQGRWMQRDPIGFGGRQANLYMYVGNDPVNRSDPSGLDDGAGGTSGEGGSEGASGAYPSPVVCDEAYDNCYKNCMQNQGADYAKDLFWGTAPFAPTPKTPYELGRTLGGGSSLTTWASRASAWLGLPANNALRGAGAAAAEATAVPYAFAGGYWAGSAAVCAAHCASQ